MKENMHIHDTRPYAVNVFANEECEKGLWDDIIRYLAENEVISEGQIVSKEIRKFPSGEILSYQADSVRDTDCYVVFQPPYGSKDKLYASFFEVCALVRALQEGDVARVTLVMTSPPMMRQDKKEPERAPNTFGLALDLLEAAGVDKFIAFQLHNPSTEGYKRGRISIQNVRSESFWSTKLLERYSSKTLSDEWVFGFVDGGIDKSSGHIVAELDMDAVVGEKRRDKESNGKSEFKGILGKEKVVGKNVIAFDDGIDTSGSAVKFGEELKKEGAEYVIMCATHGWLSDDGPKKLAEGPFDEVWVTNSCSIGSEKQFDKLQVHPIGKIMGGIIANIHNSRSLTTYMKNPTN